MNNISENKLKQSRLLYIFEAAFEYLISILVAGSFLATLTSELGFSDSLTGILSSIISLGCLFQLLSLSIRRSKVKRFVVLFSVINQSLFMFLYVIPLTSFSSKIKIVLFVVFIFLAYFIYNIAHPKKIGWLMALVSNSHRGSFTANKEIISLIMGIIFSFVMGSIIDRFTALGQTRTAFMIAAAVIFVLMLLHSASMLFAVEKEAPVSDKKNIVRTFLDLLKNKDVVHIIVVFLLYYVSYYSSTPFYGTYKISELKMSLALISAITLCGSVSRILVSKFWGRYADRRSFAVMIEKCFIFLACAQVCVIFAIPSTGKVMFVLYYILHGIALGGINSALINLIMEYIPRQDSANAIAITQAFAGVAGFISTLLVSPLVSFIQKSGNSLFGISIYAQQFVTILALIFTITAIIYIRRVFIKRTDK